MPRTLTLLVAWLLHRHEFTQDLGLVIAPALGEGHLIHLDRCACGSIRITPVIARPEDGPSG